MSNPFDFSWFDRSHRSAFSLSSIRSTSVLFLVFSSYALIPRDFLIAFLSNTFSLLTVHLDNVRVAAPMLHRENSGPYKDFIKRHLRIVYNNIKGFDLNNVPYIYILLLCACAPRTLFICKTNIALRASNVYVYEYFIFRLIFHHSPRTKWCLNLYFYPGKPYPATTSTVLSVAFA